MERELQELKEEVAKLREEIKNIQQNHYHYHQYSIPDQPSYSKPNYSIC
jgi:cell division protein FtsB